MKRNDQVKLGDIYGAMLESVQTVKHEGKYKKTDNAFTKQNKLGKGGPDNTDGYNKALNDCDCDEDEDEEEGYAGPVKGIKEIKAKIEKENDPEKKKRLQAILKEREKEAMGAENEETIKESKKIAKNRLNNFMAKKSTFDKLFESVMSENWMGNNEEDNQDDTDALGLGDAPTDDEFSDDFGGEEDSVTFTLDRVTAQELVNVLQGALGGGEEGDDLDLGDDEGDDFDFGGEGEDEDEEDFSFDEDEERGVHPTDKVGNDGTVGSKDGKGSGQQHKFQQKNNKVSGKPQPKNQGTKVVGTTDKVGNDGDYGHALHGAKQPNMGKQNKVSDLRQAEDYFR
jgi:hypothetical protein